MKQDKKYIVNGSSIADFEQCRFRWWCRWILNRVPVNESPAFGAGKLLHTIFEDAFNGKDIAEAAATRCQEFLAVLNTLPLPVRETQMKALMVIGDLTEALPLWQDTFPVTKVLEVEQPFDLHDSEEPWIVWRGRPDRVVISNNRIWHVQNRGLAASMNFGTYVRLAKRHRHEHVYAEALAQKYPEHKYGGTVFNLVRKLKFRTGVGRKDEKVKTAAEMFWQGALSIELKSPVHQAVMLHARQHVVGMREVERQWREENITPPPNDKMNGGYSGSSEDPYFKVLIGEVSLDDPAVFKMREDMYAVQEQTE